VGRPYDIGTGQWMGGAADRPRRVGVGVTQGTRVPQHRVQPAATTKGSTDMTSPTGATRLFPIIGDPIKYVESPTRFTRTLHERDRNGICVPMQVQATTWTP
jgi:hypothetical protein